MRVTRGSCVVVVCRADALLREQRRLEMEEKERCAAQLILLSIMLCYEVAVVEKGACA